jgi:membrane-associated protein
MEWLRQGIDLFLHLDKHLNDGAALLGPWLYGLLFLIVFCETGLVVTPFLPGDSLLFAVGAIAAVAGSQLSLTLLLVLLVTAAILGDALNYLIGYYVGPKVFRSEQTRFLNKKHLLRTQQFYEKHGGKTIVLARFVPIIRTFAPFVAGIGQMTYRAFAVYNVVGAVAWVTMFLFLGYFLGNRLQGQFHYVTLGIIVISVMPLVIEYFLSRRRRVVEMAAVPAEVD